MTSESKPAATGSAIKHLNEDRKRCGADDKRDALSGGKHPISRWCVIDKVLDTFSLMLFP